jgi:hypothetical protein
MSTGSPEPDEAAVSNALRTYAQAAAQVPDLITTPIPYCDLLSYAADIEVLSHWAMFNPMGPTVKAVFTAAVPGEDRLLLGHCMLNPFGSEHVVCGLFEGNWETAAEAVREHVTGFFNRNGSPQFPFLQSLPTLIWPSSQGIFSLPECATLIHRSLSNLQPVDLEEVATQMREMSGKPWDRNPPKTVFGLDEAKAQEPFDGQWPPSWETYQNWLLAVMNVEHCKAEAPHIGSAWNGAISFQEKMGNKEMAEHALPWDVPKHFMRRMLSHAIGPGSSGRKASRD